MVYFVKLSKSSKRNLRNKKKEVKKVPGVGLEPTRPKGHMALNHACLPIPAPGRGELKGFVKIHL